ncbi:hypothetical protein [Xanthomonas sp. 3075]|uniref:hypothetical protein n=1 Tax=Xanthomonas sp. 3075 TaxID=3035315 RepID=UPI00161B548F|nr:hypothetical protein [Xanthomonas sp. 3075]MBB4133363.1 dolichol kinase [Xanthomonas sp. 3075]
MNGIEFSAAQIPWGRVALYLFLSTVVLGNIATLVRARLNWADGYSRKLNHVGIMLITLPLLAFLPDEQLLPSIMIGSIGLVAIYALSAVSVHPLVFGIVSGSLRRRDAPYSRFFFFLPLISFNVTLTICAFFFPLEIVKVAFFTVALADGLAEPVGLRFGKSNSYEVKDLVWGQKNTKSIAGSAAVASVAFVVAYGMLVVAYGASAVTVVAAAIYALASAAIEAISPRGLDNMVLMASCPLILSGLIGVMI